ncbi:adenylate/guanylate cyclase domain-containing protein, partial [Rhizobium leguminosarum]
PAVDADPDPHRVMLGRERRDGMHRGTALVANIGSAERLSYTAIGDAVNLASRLVGVAKDKGVEIVLSGETLERANGR